MTATRPPDTDTTVEPAQDHISAAATLNGDTPAKPVEHFAWCADPTLCIPLPHPDDPSHLHVGVHDRWTPGEDDVECELNLFGSVDPLIAIRIDHCDGLVLGVGAARDLARRILALCDTADPDSQFVAPGIEFVQYDGGGVRVMDTLTSPKCPTWCDPRTHITSDDAYTVVHHSAPHVWDDPDLPRIEVRFERGDETNARYPDNIGMTALDITFADIDGFSIEVCDDKSLKLHGYWVTANNARAFAQWWLDLAAQIDPNNVNGAPPEWALHPPAGLRPRDEWLPGCKGIEGA